MAIEEPVFISGKEYRIERIRGFSAYATAKLHDGTITIKIPIYISGERAAKVFQSLKRRMVRSLERAKEYEPKPEYLNFYDGQVLQIMGRVFAIKTVESANQNSQARFKDGTITIRLASGLAVKERERHTYVLSSRTIVKNILPDVTARANQLNESHFHFGLGRIRLKEQSSRWGSYSKRTNIINLNFRLLFAPPEVFDSVIIHELAHIKHQNHSKRFWKLVLGAMPDYKERRKWLRKNGNLLGVFQKPDPVPQNEALSATAIQEGEQMLQVADIVNAQEPKQQNQGGARQGI
ncbi:MAG: M48 family metallopeptidase [Candidatus Micrarchaeaceae archaeon]|jgi:predicted metal-dependent hydrolase|nr:M48 family metallopeptidase [Candidatus Micrarchaeota archaeon]HII09633.1 M48 family metallopeptidase [Candidatus Micrarchaeota archaeon]